MKPPYKLPIIVRPKNGDWFVKYWYELPDQPGNYKEFRVRDGINYIKDLNEKEKFAEDLRADVQFALEHENYNPFAQYLSVKKQVYEKREQHENAGWTIEKGIEEFMAYCKWKGLSKNTIKGYQAFVNNFTAWLTETNNMDLVASRIVETLIQEFLDAYSDAEDWVPRTYNNHISFFITLFKRIEILEKKNDRELKYHVNLKDLEFKVDKAEKNRAYSTIVADRVKKELENPKHKNLRNFIKFIYLTCMRPKEIRLLQVQHIDILNKQIKVTGPTGKTGDRFVPISLELAEFLTELDFENLPLDHFLFGSGGKPAKSMFAEPYFSIKYFKIKKKLDLDKNYTLYGWKHTRVIDLVNAGFTDQQIMQLTGHTNYQSYLAYKRDLVVETTVMTGKTIGF